MLERMSVSETVAVSGETQLEISTRYNIPNRSLQNWCLKSDTANYRKCNKYTELLLAKAVISDACIAKNLSYEEYMHLFTSKATGICLRALGCRETEYNLATLFLNRMLFRETDHDGRSVVRICTIENSASVFEDTLESSAYTISEQYQEALTPADIAHMKDVLDSLQRNSTPPMIRTDDFKHKKLQKLFEDAELSMNQNKKAPTTPT